MGETLTLTPPPPFKPGTRNPSYATRPAPNHTITSRRRKRSPPGPNFDRRRNRQSMVAKVPPRGLVMGQVKILKRGEPLAENLSKKFDANPDQSAAAGARDGWKPRAMAVKKKAVELRDVDLALGSTDRLGPDPEMLQKQIRLKELNGLYAGSAFFLSPPPSSLPVPSFLARSVKAVAAAV